MLVGAVYRLRVTNIPLRTGEEREMCLYWEGVDSFNNVFMMPIGIK